MWNDVIQLEDLAQLNLKICMDELDDAIINLDKCREELSKALNNIRQLYDSYH